MQIKWPDNLQFSFVHKDKLAGQRGKTWQVLGRSKITLQGEKEERNDESAGNEKKKKHGRSLGVFL